MVINTQTFLNVIKSNFYQNVVKLLAHSVFTENNLELHNVNESIRFSRISLFLTCSLYNVHWEEHIWMIKFISKLGTCCFKFWSEWQIRYPKHSVRTFKQNVSNFEFFSKSFFKKITGSQKGIDHGGCLDLVHPP